MKRVFAHIGFSSALTLIVLNLLKTSFYIPIFGVLLSSFILSLAFKKIRSALAVPVCLLAAVFSCAVFMLTYSGFVLPQKQLDGTTSNACFYVTDDPKNTDNGYSYNAKTVYIDGKGAPQNINIKLNTVEKLQCSAYDYITTDLTFSSVGDNAYSSYGCYSNSIYLNAKTGKTYTVSNPYHKPIGYYILSLRQSIESIFTSVFYGDGAGLASALMTGDKRLLSEKVKSDFTNCGVSHLTAVSGLHLSVIIGSIYFVLKKLRLKYGADIIITFLFMWLFDAIAAFSPSVVRASIMLAIILIGNLFKRKADSLNSLGLAVFIICLNPFAVCDVGALLSVTSVLSLLTLYPILRRKLTSRKKVFDFVLSSISASVSILIFTFPILWLFYGTVTVTSLLLNIFMIPVAEFTMICLLILIATSRLSYIGYVFANMASFGLTIMMRVTSFVSSLPLPSLNFGSAITGIAVGIVLLIMSIPFLMKSKKLIKVSSIISAMLFVFTIGCGYAFDINKTYLRMSSDSQSSSVMMYNNDCAVIIGNMSQMDYYTYRHIARSRDVDILLMIAPDSKMTYYNDKITRDVKTHNYVLTDNNGISTTESVSDNLLYSSDFTVNISDDIKVTYNKNSNGFYSVIKINEKSVVINDSRSDLQSDCNVLINIGKRQQGCHGEYDVLKSAQYDKGDIIFEFKDGAQTLARRESVWLQ